MGVDCPIKGINGHACGRPAVDTDGLCIFHSRSEKDPTAFSVEFLKYINQANRIQQDEEIDCSFFVFPDFAPDGKWHIAKPISFEHAVFHGITNLNLQFAHHASFEEAVFAGNCSFSDCEFQNGATFSRARFERAASFDRIVFRGGVNFDDSHFRGHADFLRTEFTDVVTFENAQFAYVSIFLQARFNNRADFSGSEFSEVANFNKTTFKEDASFPGSQFMGGVEFEEAEFMGVSDFKETRFSGPVSFLGSEFHGPAFFEGASFSRTAGFGSCQFHSDALFIGTSFVEDGHFSGAKFAGPAVFRQIRIDSYVSFDGAEFAGDGYFQDLDFRSLIDKGQTVQLDFGDVTIRGIDRVRFEGRGGKSLDLSSTSFAFTDVFLIRFLNVTFQNDGGMNNLSRRDRVHLWLAGKTSNEFVKVIEEAFIAHDSSHLVNAMVNKGKFMNIRWQHVGAIYKGLRESYERSLRHAEAGQFHIREMEMRRFGSVHEGMCRTRKWLRRNISVLNAYRWLSLYGESYRLAAIWVVVAIISFALVGNCVNSDSSTALTDSALAFLQLKSETTLDLVERVFGLVLVALFGLALHRNFRR